MQYPQEDAQVKITNEIARIHVANLKQSLKNLPIELRFNMSEGGYQE
jgi:hypothetical protein